MNTPPFLYERSNVHRNHLETVRRLLFSLFLSLFAITVPIICQSITAGTLSGSKVKHNNFVSPPYLPSSHPDSWHGDNYSDIKISLRKGEDGKRRVVVYGCTHGFDRTRLLPLLKYIPLEPGGCIRSPLSWNAEYDYPSPGKLKRLDVASFG